MSHTCGRSSSENSHLCNRQSKATDKKCCCGTTLTGCSKYFNIDEGKRKKLRRLKTRKERCQLRAGRNDTLKSNSHHHRCFCQSSRDSTFFPNCCNSCHLPTRKNSSVPVTHEPSIITDSRLIGHHGLFNHEVKSINIERLLSDQRELGQNEEKTEAEKNKIFSTLRPTPSNPVLFSSGHFLSAEADESVPAKKKADATTKTHEDSQETEMMNFQFSNPEADITPGQKVQQQLYSSCKSPKSINQSENSFQATKNKESLQMQSPGDGDKIETLNRRINQRGISDIKPPDTSQNYPAQAAILTSSPLRPVTSLSVDQQHLPRDPDHVSKHTHAVTARLCECLHIPALNRRNLLSETREVLLKSLQERHGPHLQSNLQKVKLSPKFLQKPKEATATQVEHLIKEDELLSTDTSVKTTGSEHFCWKFSPQSRNSWQQNTEETANPVDSFSNFLDETFRFCFSSPVHMDFELPEASVSDLFAKSPILQQGENVTVSELWENDRSKTEESVLFDPFQNNFMSHTRDRERISEQQPHRSTDQPFFSYQDGQSADLQCFPQNPSKSDGFYFAPFFTSQNRHQPQSNHQPAFGQLSTFRPNIWPSPTNMMHYSPSHMLERTLAPPTSFLPSPEHWSFPPMRLY